MNDSWHHCPCGSCQACQALAFGGTFIALNAHFLQSYKGTRQPRLCGEDEFRAGRLSGMGRRSTFLLWVFSLTLTADAFFPATSFDCIKNYATQCPDGLCCSVGGVCTQNPGGGSYICCDQRTDGDCGAEDPLGIADIPVPDQPTVCLSLTSDACL